jgi:SMI1/KNR4 family protein SUKH-1
MPDTGRKVTLLGRTTQVFLRDCGPEVSEADIAVFEKGLGYRLPDDYRDFLLRYNGGYPIVTAVTGRDDDPNLPYAHGDGVRGFYKLQTPVGPVKSYERLRTPCEIEEAYGLGLPFDALEIGDDEGGNMIMMELGHPKYLIRFVDHERLDSPFATHRVLAEGFTDLLMRFRTVEE